MTFTTEVVAERISAEILRVSAHRERLMHAAKAAGTEGQMRPRLSLMDQAMHFAREARDERCPVAMLSWLSSLRDFKE